MTLRSDQFFRSFRAARLLLSLPRVPPSLHPDSAKPTSRPNAAVCAFSKASRARRSLRKAAWATLCRSFRLRESKQRQLGVSLHASSDRSPLKPLSIESPTGSWVIVRRSFAAINSHPTSSWAEFCNRFAVSPTGSPGSNPLCASRLNTAPRAESPSNRFVPYEKPQRAVRPDS